METKWLLFCRHHFVSKGPINNIPALIQIMAKCTTRSKPLSEWWLGCQRIYASLSLNELNWAYQRTADWTEQQQQHWSWPIVFFLFCDEIHGPFLPLLGLQVHVLMTAMLVIYSLAAMVSSLCLMGGCSSAEIISVHHIDKWHMEGMVNNMAQYGHQFFLFLYKDHGSKHRDSP